MANLRDIRRRIVSIENTQKITSAMKMVAAAKLRRAQQAVEAARPYAANMRQALQEVVAGEADAENGRQGCAEDPLNELRHLPLQLSAARMRI